MVVRSPYESCGCVAASRKPEDMTAVLDAAVGEPPSERPSPSTRHGIVNAGTCVPADALTDHVVAEWVRTRGASVTAADDRDLDLVQYHGIRAVQVVFRCGSAAEPIHRAVRLGVSRLIVSTAVQIARVAESAHDTKYLYLEAEAPLVLGDRRLKVFGLHSDICDAYSASEWAAAARCQVQRGARLRAFGAPVKRIALSGGSTQLWHNSQAARLTSIMCAVDEAVRDECEKWQLSRPAVSLAALTAANTTDIAGRLPGLRSPFVIRR